MSVTLDLRLIDHDRIAVHGLQIVNDAIRHQDPERLREYLYQLPIDVNATAVEHRKSRCATLRKLKAPAIIIDNEEKLLRQANGEAYQRENIRAATFDELRRLLGTWCWMTHTYPLPGWQELDWFLEPVAGPAEFPLDPIRPGVGDPKQSLYTKALQGAVAYPKDELGDPVIRTLGSQESDCSGYNPPETARAILNALRSVEPARWDESIPLRAKLYHKASPETHLDGCEECADQDRSQARDTFPVLLSAYVKAVELGYGVSCEYSL